MRVMHALPEPCESAQLSSSSSMTASGWLSAFAALQLCFFKRLGGFDNVGLARTVLGVVLLTVITYCWVQRDVLHVSMHSVGHVNSPSCIRPGQVEDTVCARFNCRALGAMVHTMFENKPMLGVPTW